MLKLFTIVAMLLAGAQASEEERIFCGRGQCPGDTRLSEEEVGTTGYNHGTHKYGVYKGDTINRWRLTRLSEANKPIFLSNNRLDAHKEKLRAGQQVAVRHLSEDESELTLLINIWDRLFSNLKDEVGRRLSEDESSSPAFIKDISELIHNFETMFTDRQLSRLSEDEAEGVYYCPGVDNEGCPTVERERCRRQANWGCLAYYE